ncbi:hypothetical protein SAY87_015728 [Trapa incisa]|uniref:Uncharacterized protein n=1 Tax=Trapa incisa TaxID=236973 RepID=A0AAN7L4S7_9MYRT|nr:hypothetical protein SAY87_015728 [Trapa incisa]
MVKYSREPDNPTKSCKASGSDHRVQFKPKVQNICISTLHYWSLETSFVVLGDLTIPEKLHFPKEDASGEGQKHFPEWPKYQNLYIPNIVLSRAEISG